MVFSKPRYPRYAIDQSHPAIRYAIAGVKTVSGRYAATFSNNGPCLLCTDSFQASTTFLEQLSCTALHPNTIRGA